VGEEALSIDDSAAAVAVPLVSTEEKEGDDADEVETFMVMNSFKNEKQRRAEQTFEGMERKTECVIGTIQVVC
jgi:hypothetical protein